MCGITGIYAYRDSAPPIDRNELLRIRDQMIRRGPDGAGLWLSNDGRTGLGHRRLAIIDLSAAGAQPMANADGRYVVTFNGEIYNYRELRRELQDKETVFRSHSDTEVLLHLYADRGERMVDALRGMYAFAIWDNTERTLFLARDPFGIKPLYYADDGKTFRFASQVKALLAGGAIDTTPEPAGSVGFFILGSVPEPYTLYRHIRALPAGAAMIVHRGSVGTPHAFFDVRETLLRAQDAPADPDSARATLSEAVRDSVKAHLVGDVPVGIFLSAGVDSGAITGVASETGISDLHTLTLGFREFRGMQNDEVPFAEAVARHYGTTHQTDWISRQDFELEMAAILAAMDQPSIDGVNTYLVSRAAARAGMKVALSGLGGDELLGGYPSFRQVPRVARALAWAQHMPWLGKGARRLTAGWLDGVTSPKFAGVLEYGSTFGGAYLLRRSLFMPWEIDDLLDPATVRAGLDQLDLVPRLNATAEALRTPHACVAALELAWYMRNQLLRDADWAGMAHSIEIRVPLVDTRLFEAIGPAMVSSAPPTKAELAHVPARPLPQGAVRRAKTGFTTPVREWVGAGRRPQGRGLRGWAERVMSPQPKLLRVLALVTDAYGGHGGIALYNRDLLQALCSFPGCARVVAIPRRMPNPPEPMPEKLAYLDTAVGGKLNYIATALRVLRGDRGHALVVCGHINLMPLAWLVSRFLDVPLVLYIYGIDAWKPTRNLLANALAKRASCVVAISAVTAWRFRSWASSTTQKLLLLPNAIHADWYGPGAKSPALLERYRLEGKTVLMTLGRLVSAERYKGFDETLEVLPELIEVVPNVAYLIVGDGSDRERLAQKARALGVADRVVFAGNIAEAEKADHYRLADAYVMPSKGEGFGFVLLEAMACGIPVVASKLDGGREAVRDGQLGILVDPADQRQLKRAILEALARPKGIVPAGLEHFSYPNFEARAHALFGQVLSASPQPMGR